MPKSNKPIVWGFFAAGGTLTAFVTPVLVVLTLLVGHVADRSDRRLIVAVFEREPHRRQLRALDPLREQRGFAVAGGSADQDALPQEPPVQLGEEPGPLQSIRPQTGRAQLRTQNTARRLHLADSRTRSRRMTSP